MTIIGSVLAEEATALLSVPAPMVLDNVMFSGPEVPSSIRLGGEQGLVVHRMPGGCRILDVMGPDENAVQWTGVLVGPGASSKAMLLSAMRRIGGVRQLSFADTVLSIVITKFEYAYQSQGLLIPYTLRGEVVPDGGMITAAGQVRSDTETADLNAGNTFIGSGVGAVSTYGDLVDQATRDVFVGLSTSLEATQARISDLLQPNTVSPSSSFDLMQQSLTTCLTDAGTLLPISLDAVGSSSSLITALLACSTSAAVAMARGYVGRARQDIA